MAAPATGRLVINDSVRDLVTAAAVPTLAQRDTVYLLGDTLDSQHPPQHAGTFQDCNGDPAWNGWSHEDLTIRSTLHWQASDSLPPQGQYAMWCGATFAGDVGYGNGWQESLVFTESVADPGVVSVVH